MKIMKRVLAMLLTAAMFAGGMGLTGDAAPAEAPASDAQYTQSTLGAFYSDEIPIEEHSSTEDDFADLYFSQSSEEAPEEEEEIPLWLYPAYDINNVRYHLPRLLRSENGILNGYKKELEMNPTLTLEEYIAFPEIQETPFYTPQSAFFKDIPGGLNLQEYYRMYKEYGWLILSNYTRPTFTSAYTVEGITAEEYNARITEIYDAFMADYEASGYPANTVNTGANRWPYSHWGYSYKIVPPVQAHRFFPGVFRGADLYKQGTLSQVKAALDDLVQQHLRYADTGNAVQSIDEVLKGHKIGTIHSFWAGGESLVDRFGAVKRYNVGFIRTDDENRTYGAPRADYAYVLSKEDADRMAEIAVGGAENCYPEYWDRSLNYAFYGTFNAMKFMWYQVYKPASEIMMKYGMVPEVEFIWLFDLDIPRQMFANGGTLDPDDEWQWVKYDEPYGEENLPQPSRSGYTFKGWNTAADGSGRTVTAQTVVEFASVLALYAQWESAPAHTLTYTDKQGTRTETYTADDGEQSAMADTLLDIRDFPDSDAKPLYWIAAQDSASEGTIVKPGESFEISGDTTLYAVYDFTRHVTYHVDWHNYETGEDISLEPYADEEALVRYYHSGSGAFYTIENGSERLLAGSEQNALEVTVDDIAQAHRNPAGGLGSTFKGWNTKPDGSGTPRPAGGVEVLSPGGENVHLYAQWQFPAISITYRSAGQARQLPEPQALQQTAAFTVAEQEPLRYGHVFKGWSTSENPGLDDVDFLPGQANCWVNPEKQHNSSLDLFAVWERTGYVVSFAANGAGVSSLPEPQVQPFNKTLQITQQQPQRAGHEFVGWSENPAGPAQQQYGPGQTYAQSRDITLYAIWREVYDIRFMDSDGETYYEALALRVQNGSTFKLPASPEKEGHTFKGWRRIAGGSITNILAAGATRTPAADETWQAVWTAETYKVLFKDRGTTKATQTKTFGEALALAPPALADTPAMRFRGWTAAEPAPAPAQYFDGIADYDTALPYEENRALTLHAVWQPVYTITYNDPFFEDTVLPAPQQKLHGEPAAIAGIAETRDGLVFLGWSTNPATLELSLEYRPGRDCYTDGDAALYAVWSQMQYPGSDDSEPALFDTVTITLVTPEGETQAVVYIPKDRQSTQVRMPHCSNHGYGSFTGWAENGSTPSSAAVLTITKEDEGKKFYAAYSANINVNYNNTFYRTETAYMLYDNSYDSVLSHTMRPADGARFLRWERGGTGYEANMRYEFRLPCSSNALHFTAQREPAEPTDPTEKPIRVNYVTASGSSSVNLPSGIEQFAVRALTSSGALQPIGWTKDAALTALEPQYAADGSAVCLVAEGETAVTLYAIYETGYSLTYDSANGSEPAAETFGPFRLHTGGTVPESQVTIARDNPQREGYRFTGWRAQNGTIYPQNSSLLLNSSMTLTAQWLRQNNITYSSSGTQLQSVWKDFDAAHSIAPAPQAAPYKRFAGWQAADGTVYWPGDNYSADAALALTALWKNEYQVEFHASIVLENGVPQDSILLTDVAVEGEPYTLPSSLQPQAPAGKRFAGWADNNGNPVQFPAAIAGNTNFYAVWEDSGEEPALRSISISGSSGNEIQFKTREKASVNGLNVTGWHSSDTSVLRVDSSGMLTARHRGSAVITATLEDGSKVSETVNVTYAWWQWLIQIFLFGWIWYDPVF